MGRVYCKYGFAKVRLSCLGCLVFDFTVFQFIKIVNSRTAKQEPALEITSCFISILAVDI